MNAVIEGQVVETVEAAEKEPPKALAAQPAASPLDLPAVQFREGLDRRRENRQALMEWVREALVEDTDYGRIHVVKRDKCPKGKYCNNPGHFSKPSLFKPGAEKICGMLGVTVHYPTLHDYEQAALHGVQLAHVIIRCEIHDAAGRVVADGVGARSLRQDYGDINKALKMAEKSAHIDATLRMAGLSEVFTQDIEDMKLDREGTEPPNAGKAAAPSHPTPSRAAVEPSGSGPVPPGKNGTFSFITPHDHRRLEARIAELGLERERVKAWVGKAWGVAHLNEVPAVRLQELLARLQRWAAQAEAGEAAAEREAIRQEAQP